jgi:hypothetical protein
MKANTRACIAYIAGSMINKKSYSSLIDHSEQKTVKMSGRIDFNNIDVQMEDDGSKIVGLVRGNEVSFFHSVEKGAIKMKIEGSNFKGNDSSTGKDFMGSVNGKAVKIYDYGDYQNYFFALGE